MFAGVLLSQALLPRAQLVKLFVQSGLEGSFTSAGFGRSIAGCDCAHLADSLQPLLCEAERGVDMTCLLRMCLFRAPQFVNVPFRVQ